MPRLFTFKRRKKQCFEKEKKIMLQFCWPLSQNVKYYFNGRRSFNSYSQQIWKFEMKVMQMSKTNVLSCKAKRCRCHNHKKNMENYFRAKKTHSPALTPFLSFSSHPSVNPSQSEVGIRCSTIKRREKRQENRKTTKKKIPVTKK